MAFAPPDKCPVCGGSRVRKDGLIAVHSRPTGAATEEYRKATGIKFKVERCPGSNNPPLEVLERIE